MIWCAGSQTRNWIRYHVANIEIIEPAYERRETAVGSNIHTITSRTGGGGPVCAEPAAGNACGRRRRRGGRCSRGIL